MNVITIPNLEIKQRLKKIERTEILKAEVPSKLILLYTPIFGVKPWAGIGNDYQFTNWNKEPCKVRNCRISYDEKEFSKSDAIIFHGQDIDVKNLRQISRMRRADQRWIFFIHENPTNFRFHSDLPLFDNVFNWTMTYKLSSDIFVPYSFYHPHEENKEAPAGENYLFGKDRLVAWIVSHCGTPRDRFVKKLMEYIPVDVYGACAPKFSQPEKCRRGDSCLKKLRRYKFYLAFENEYCVDYITEKYWSNSLLNNIVPVVLGGGNYTDRNLAVPGSFVNALDFVSVKQLADYLVMLDRNDTAYNEYFAWRKLYYVASPIPGWPCKICSMLNDVTLPAKSYNRESFARFWSRKSNCEFVNEAVERIITLT